MSHTDCFHDAFFRKLVEMDMSFMSNGDYIGQIRCNFRCRLHVQNV